MPLQAFCNINTTIHWVHKQVRFSEPRKEDGNWTCLHYDLSQIKARSKKNMFPYLFFLFLPFFFFLKRTASTSSRRHCVLRIALIKSLGRMWPILACEESYRCHSITVTSAASSPLNRARSYLFTAFQLGLRWNKESLNHAHCAKQPIRAHPKGALKSCYVSSHILPY